MFNAWIERGETLAERFRTAEPFPLLAIDDFLDAPVARALLAESPAPDAMPRSRDRVFGDEHLPPGVTRKSIATYAIEKVAQGSAVPRTTGWSPNSVCPPGRTLARHHGPAVKVRTALFGSVTLKNR